MLIDAVVNIKSYWRHPTNLIALEFGVVSFSFTTIHNIFMLYFVDLFLFHYGLKLSWLWLSQICFVIWNFGSHYLLGNPKESSIYGGPVLAGVFLCPFVFRILSLICLFLPKEFSTSDTFIGIYFTFFLCLYDTIFNRVLLSRSIWLQENVVQLKDKLKIHFLGFIFASVASCAVFPSYLYYPYRYTLSNQRELKGTERGGFRWFCLAISMLSFLGFIFSSFCHIMREGEAKMAQNSSSISSSSSSSTPTKSSMYHQKNTSSPSSTPTSASLSSHTHKYNYNTTRSDANTSTVSLQIFTSNVMSHTNMAIYIVVNLLQVFSSTFSVVFLHLFISCLKDHVNTGKVTQATILFVCFFSPVLMNIILSVIANKRETYDLLRFLFQVKIGISVFALVFGSHLFVVAVFTIFSRAIVESVFGLLMFVNQDVDSEHHVKFGYRKASQRLVSVGKIGQAAAPIVGAMSFTTYQQPEGLVDVSSSHLYYSTILVMLLSGGVQLFMWSKYTLRGSYLKDINIMAKGKFVGDVETIRGGGLKYSGGYGDGGGEREIERDRGGGREAEEQTLRYSFGDSLFDNPTSPNLTNIATMPHKQVITVV